MTIPSVELITTPAYKYSNSYVTLAEAEDYLANHTRYDLTNWNNLSEVDKKYCLIFSAFMLNSFTYRGIKVVQDQALAFPRYTNFEVITYDYSTWYSFEDVLDDSALDVMVANGNINIFSNTFIDADNSGAFDNNNLKIGKVIKVEGYSNADNNGLFSIKSVSSNELEVFEDLTDETAPSSGIDIYLTQIPMIPIEVKKAQIELAFQVVQNKIMLDEVKNEMEQNIRGISLDGVMYVTYYNTSNSVGSKFLHNIGTLDKVYLYLHNWLASVGGRVV